MTTLIQSGLDLKPILTHRLPYREFEQGFDTMIAGKSGKIILNWD
jgi:threonine 3-dehydrogenase